MAENLSPVEDTPPSWSDDSGGLEVFPYTQERNLTQNPFYINLGNLWNKSLT